MKILQVVHAFPPFSKGGTEIYTSSLSKELTKRHQVSVFYRISAPQRKEYQVEQRTLDGLNTFRINNTFRFCNSFEMFYRNGNITEGFSRVLDNVKPDLVHIQHLIFLSTTIVNEIKKRKIPMVFTLHDYWLICAQWHFLKKDFSICDNDDISQCVDCLDYQLSIKKLPKRIYSTFRNIIPDFLIPFLRSTYLNLEKTNLNSREMLEKIKARIANVKELCSMVDLFIAPSRFLKRKFMEFAIPEDKIKFIPCGIDRELFKDFKKRESNKIRFGFVGTILPAKGLDILINAFNRIKDNRAELRIYGRLFPYQGFEYYPRYVKRRAKNRNIRFMGGFDHKDISEVFSEIDVLVVPSIWYENFPLTIQEAFLARLPVIASNIGGIPELVQDGKNGLLFQVNNTDDLYQKIKLIIDESDRINILSQNIQMPKSIKENAQEMKKIYVNLLSENSK